MMDCLLRGVRVLELQNRNGERIGQSDDTLPSTVLLAVDQTYLTYLVIVKRKVGLKCLLRRYAELMSLIKIRLPKTRSLNFSFFKFMLYKFRYLG